MTSACMNIQSHDIYDFKLINPLGTFFKVKGSYSGYYMPLVLDFCFPQEWVCTVSACTELCTSMKKLSLVVSTNFVPRSYK